jgi:hypothetical protein
MADVATPANPPAQYTGHRYDDDCARCSGRIWWVSTNPVWRHLDSLTEACPAPE